MSVSPQVVVTLLDEAIAQVAWFYLEQGACNLGQGVCSLCVFKGCQKVAVRSPLRRDGTRPANLERMDYMNTVCEYHDVTCAGNLKIMEKVEPRPYLPKVVKRGRDWTDGVFKVTVDEIAREDERAAKYIRIARSIASIETNAEQERAVVQFYRYVNGLVEDGDFGANELTQRDIAFIALGRANDERFVYDTADYDPQYSDDEDEEEEEEEDEESKDDA